MKQDIWLGAVFSMALLLGACAMNIPTNEPETAPAVIAEVSLPPAEETQAAFTEQEQAVAQCRAVLDEVQSGTSYKITMTRWYEGVWDRTQKITYYRSGDNRAIVTLSSSDNHDGQYISWMDTSMRIGVDGKVYSGYAEIGSPLDWEGPLTDETMTFDPWLYTFDWDAQSVELQEIRTTEDGRCITFRVDGTYPEDRVLSEYYTVSFYFDQTGRFLMRELTATGVEQKFLITENGLVASGEPAEGSGILTRVDRVTVESLDPDTCSNEINAFYREALDSLN